MGLRPAEPVPAPHHQCVRYIQLADTSGSTLGTFDNVASTTTLGTDLNVSYRRGPLTLFGVGSAWRYGSGASNLVGDLSARAFIWSLRANATYRLSALTDVQGFANCRAPQNTDGGRQDASVFMNLGVRHKAWGEQGSISLRLADPFNLTKFGSRIQSPQAIELTERRFGQRALVLSISRTFGQQLELRPRQDDTQQAAPAIPGTPD
ncbi:MAG: TonB-dependent receptor [Gemmatimonadetes bacterium]|nr:TonB-dependent receptor [Gemmatimonadota bacterium]